MSLNSDDWNWEALRRQGELLLGAEHRLQIAVLVAGAEREELYAARIAQAAGVDRKEASREVARFKGAGLLVPAPRQPGSPASTRGRPPEFLVRQNEPTWRAFVELARLLERPN